MKIFTCKCCQQEFDDVDNSYNIHNTGICIMCDSMLLLEQLDEHLKKEQDNSSEELSS